MSIVGFIKDIFIQKTDNEKYTPLNSRKILWSIVPNFVYNTKEKKILTSFKDPLWLDKDNNVMGEMISYKIDNNATREALINKINNSKFTIVYQLGETEWKLLLYDDFKKLSKKLF